MMRSPSSRQYSGTSAAYDMNASTSGSATLASPSCSSASDVCIAVTGCSADGAAPAPSVPPCPCVFCGLPSPPRSGVVNAVEGGEAGEEDDGAALKAAPASEADFYTSPLAAIQWRCKASGAVLK